MIGITLLLAGVAYVLVTCYKNAYKRLDNFPPGPPSLPVYGAYWIVLLTELNNLAGSLKKLGERYKTKILGFYLGKFQTIVINDPDILKEMLHSEDFDGRNDIILGRLRSYWKKLGIFFTDGYFWHVQRRFSLRHMRDFGFGRRDENLETIIESEIKEMIDMGLNGAKNAAEEEIVKGDLIYLPHYFTAPFINGLIYVLSRMTLPREQYKRIWDLARGTLLFQRSSNDLGAAITFTPWLKDVLPNFSGYNGLKEGNQCLLDFFATLVQQAKETRKDTYSSHFIDIYLKRMEDDIKEHGKSTFSVDQLVLTCTDYMFPTATATEAVLTMLVERMLLQPEIQDKVHEEIDRVVGRDRLPNLDDRKNMPYTEACIREMMRHETLVPLGVLHRSVKDLKFHGYDIPENTIVAANFVMLHMDRKIWGDPESFRPERFITDGQLDLTKDKSLPFGAGKRLCAGETYARQTMFQVFAGFMQTFRVSTTDGHPLKAPAPRIQGIITTLPNFWVRIMPRN